MKVLGMLLMVVMISGCTDATRSKFFSFGESRTIECYSGGKLIYKGKSSGKISSEANSDGYFFKEAKSGQLIEVSGDCILRSI